MGMIIRGQFPVETQLSVFRISACLYYGVTYPNRQPAATAVISIATRQRRNLIQDGPFCVKNQSVLSLRFALRATDCKPLQSLLGVMAIAEREHQAIRLIYPTQ